MPNIGSHVSFSDKGLLNAAEEAVSYGSSTFMIYTGAPQNTRRKPIEDQYIEEGKALMDKHAIGEIVVHAPYIINLGSYKEDTFELAVRFLQEEIRRTDYIGVKNIVLHPGAYTDKDADYGIARIADGLNEVLAGVKDTNVKIALETMAGKGTEIGRSFEEIAEIIERVEENGKISVCLDTCHIHDAGYDIVNDLDGVLHHFDKVVGLERLGVIHLNDSKNPRGASKDRHSPLGSGWIGFEAMNNVANHPKLQHLPMILETPWIGKEDKTQRPMYEVEIALLSGKLSGRFGGEFLDQVERIDHALSQKDIHHRDYVLGIWDVLKNDAKAKKADGREPLERLYDILFEERVLADLTEEQINQRLIVWLAGKDVLKKA
ncbi:putative endonuclease 4 [Paenibacillus marchantiophytorum]|uniref:Probable endonuclease 4 n=1 Tax=Paenibacillus marchantiophytorum TaxID=1619310 RepID=A0ABQ2BTX9_9BACL|nr:deoxyribonuclease IV [Paenibacillus marchantiophytorum]GGI46027.1 putative endonuclease 4 [Paenibacillus marchantiophytorum]